MKPIGRTSVRVTELGFGAASIGNLYKVVPDEEAAAAVQAAWDRGVRYFDTAPHYGLGLSERRLGAVLGRYSRDGYTLSTKVGRLIVPNLEGEGRRDLDNGFDVPATLRRQWDFSADGVRRSLDESMERLGLDRIDIVLIHDPEESSDPEGALRHAAPALADLRSQGVIGAFGVGSKQVAILQRFVTETDLDTIMLAGRYTLLEQPALDELLPACEKHGVSVLNVGVFNSGLLARDRPEEGGKYEYSDAPAELVDKARRIAAVCREHGTTLPHAALVFGGAHPTVASVVVGAGRAAHFERNADLAAAPPPPPELWQELIAQGLLRPDAPVPAS
jgi:D-threo-aldose 1-dehydrogenase